MRHQDRLRYHSIVRSDAHAGYDREPFVFHTDPGHGWLEVSIHDLALVGLHEGCFSHYSYKSRDGNTLYLEEDCDAPKFRDHWTATFGRFNATDKYASQSFVRNLPRTRGRA